MPKEYKRQLATERYCMPCWHSWQLGTYCKPSHCEPREGFRAPTRTRFGNFVHLFREHAFGHCRPVTIGNKPRSSDELFLQLLATRKKPYIILARSQSFRSLHLRVLRKSCKLHFQDARSALQSCLRRMQKTAEEGARWIRSTTAYRMAQILLMHSTARPNPTYLFEIQQASNCLCWWRYATVHLQGIYER